ncbi:hypothetical protein LCGC14_1536470 [marine sediment metagenome]|uniref:HTH tetR-type domain-containing protein n=1 Tax=marine sediment metagenome TaxID=412755 RepID=A0A0F9IUF4_9ZZZZ|nr:TetR family transcriptional regulator [Methylophaga sp.]
MRRTKEDAAKTRQNVIDAALKLFSQRGYSGTTLRLIAYEAGCSRGPIYWHFANKEVLFEEILALSQEPLEKLITQSNQSEQPEEGARKFAHQWLTMLFNDPYYRQSFEILLNKTEFTESVSPFLERERALTASLIDTFSGFVERYRTQNKLTNCIDSKVVAVSMYSYLMGVTQSWMVDAKINDLANNIDFYVGEFVRLMQSPQ